MGGGELTECLIVLTENEADVQVMPNQPRSPSTVERSGSCLPPVAMVKDAPTIPGELFAKFQTNFYADPTDAVFKALGVE